MPNAYDDSVKVIQALQLFPNGLSLRLLSSALGWETNNGRYRADTARVHRALTSLALDKRVELVNKRWRAVKRS